MVKLVKCNEKMWMNHTMNTMNPKESSMFSELQVEKWKSGLSIY